MPEDKEDQTLDDFKNDFPTEESLQDSDPDFLTPKEPSEQEATHGKEEGEGHKNREHRRLNRRVEQERDALQELREANIAENARLQTLSEQRKFLEGLPKQTIDERINSIFSQDEVGRKGAAALQSLIDDAVEQAETRAVERLQETQQERDVAVRQESQFIDNELVDLEEVSGIDLTSNTPLGRKNRSDFLDLVEKFSPKDADGDVQEYADFEEVFDVFKQTRTRASNNTQNKSLASRGMARGSSPQQSVGDKATETALRNMGII